MKGLIEAVDFDKIDLARDLLKEKALVDEVDEFGDTALLKAAWNCNIKAIKILLDYGANINFKDESGDTPLFTCVQSSVASYEMKKNTFTLLLKEGADCNHVNDLGESIVDILHFQGGLEEFFFILGFKEIPENNNNLPFWS
jgi:ankyrin repeat protein